MASSPGASGLVWPGAEQHPVAGVGEVGGGHRGAAGPDRGQRGLVDQVGQVRAGEPGGSRGDLAEVGVWAEGLVPGVGGQDGLPLGPVRQRDDDLAVEPAGQAQRLVEGVRPVGGGQHHHPAGLVESVHLGEQLVEGLLPLVAAAETAVVAAGAEGIDLVDEHDRRRAAAGLLEQVPDPGSADADEHLDEARARYREERDVRLAGHRAGEQGLAGTGRPGHEHAARSAGPGAAVAAGVAQVVHHLADLSLHRGVAGHVGKPGGRPLGVDDPRLGPGHAARPAQPAEPSESCGLLAGVPDDVVDQGADEQQGQQADQHRQRRGGHAGGGGGGDLNVMGGQVTGQAVAAEGKRDVGGERLPAGQDAGHLPRRADGHRADHPGADIGHEPAVGQRRARGRAARQRQQRQDAG